MCDLEDIGAPSIFKLISGVTDLVRLLSTLDLICEENAARYILEIFNVVRSCRNTKKTILSLSGT